MGTKNLNILCNSTLAIPCLEELIRAGRIQSIGMPETQSDAVFFITQIAKQAFIPVRFFSKGTLQEQLTLWLSEFPCKAVVCMTFPFKIPASVLSIPNIGFVNVHFALLPEYRGAEPIFWEIKNREQYGGITVHMMNEQWDKGNILFLRKIKILSNETHGKHLSNLSRESLHIIPELLTLIDQGNSLKGETQAQGSYKPKPSYNDVKLDWQQDESASLLATIKACNPWNKGAISFLNGYELRIIEAAITASFYGKQCGTPGSILISPNKNHFAICCKDGKFLNPEILYTNEGFHTTSTIINGGLNQNLMFH